MTGAEYVAAVKRRVFFHLRRASCGSLSQTANRRPLVSSPLARIPSRLSSPSLLDHTGSVPSKERGRLLDCPSSIWAPSCSSLSLVVLPFVLRVMTPSRGTGAAPINNTRTRLGAWPPRPQARFCASFFSVDRSAEPSPLSLNGLF